jgi:hypothetical protein
MGVHSHTSGVFTARNSNSPLSSGTSCGQLAAHTQQVSKSNSPRR